MTRTTALHAQEASAQDVAVAPVGAGASRAAALFGGVGRLLGDRHRTFVVVIGAALVAALLISLPLLLVQDTWLALVDGRQIVHHGLPHHVVLTIFGHGHAWIDQQWLAQLCMYGLMQVGGVALVGIVNVALIAVALAGGVAASTRLGAGRRAVLLVFPLIAVIAAVPNDVRTQPYAYPLFVLIVYLLAADSRRPTRRVYWCLPVLLLWANLHGSATLGAGLVVLRGITMLWNAARHRDVAATPWRRAVALIVSAPLALLVTPYGTAVISYYRATLLSPAFRHFVTEWQPVTIDVPVAVLFFLLAGVVVWSLGRYGEESTLWERAATLILAAGAILAVRNVVWFGLTTLVLLPVWIDQAARARGRLAPPRPRLNGSLLAAAGAVVVILALHTLSAATSTLTPIYPEGALAAVRAAVATRPGARVFADERYADWLLWELPSLRGRVAYDAAFELLSAAQLDAIADFKSVSGLDWQRAAAGDAVLVLAATRDASSLHALRVQAGARLLYDRDGVAVLER